MCPISIQRIGIYLLHKQISYDQNILLFQPKFVEFSENGITLVYNSNCLY